MTENKTDANPISQKENVLMSAALDWHKASNPTNEIVLSLNSLSDVLSNKERQILATAFDEYADVLLSDEDGDVNDAWILYNLVNKIRS
jgi:predicted nucleic acid-binding protein